MNRNLEFLKESILTQDDDRDLIEKFSTSLEFIVLLWKLDMMDVEQYFHGHSHYFIHLAVDGVVYAELIRKWTSRF